MQPYQLTSGSQILRVDDGAMIPDDPLNSDYQNYLAWVAAGNQPDPLPDATLATLKADQSDAIKDERDLRTATGGYAVQLAVGLKWFQSDTGSRIQQLGLARAGDKQIAAGGQLSDALIDVTSGKQTIWKTFDGSFAPLTVSDSQNIFLAAAASDAATFTYAEELLAMVAASTDPLSINILAGWPKIYGE